MSESKQSTTSLNPKRWQPRVYWRDDLALFDERLERPRDSDDKRQDRKHLRMRDDAASAAGRTAAVFDGQQVGSTRTRGLFSR
jgi:hypothetical protein